MSKKRKVTLIIVMIGLVASMLAPLAAYTR